MAIKGSLRPGQLGISLTVCDASKAVRFYRDAFDAEIVKTFTLKDGTPHSFELRAFGIIFFVASANPRPDAYEKHGSLRGADAIGGSTVLLHVYVDDVDTAVERVRTAGGTLRSGGPWIVEETSWGDRIAQFTDPFGYAWRLATHVEDVSYDELPAREAAAAARYKAARDAGTLDALFARRDS